MNGAIGIACDEMPVRYTLSLSSVAEDVGKRKRMVAMVT